MYHKAKLDLHLANLNRLGFDKEEVKEFYEKNNFIDDSIFSFKEQFKNKSYVNTILHPIETEEQEDDPYAHLE